MRPSSSDLGLFFHPRSIAVIGASDREGSPNRTYWNLIRDWGRRQGAQVFPINPHRSVIDNDACFDSIESLPEKPNVVAILTGDPIPALQQVIEHEVDFAVIFASGYAEAGPEGAERQRQLRQLVSGSKTRLIGPNTNLNSFERFRDDLEGSRVALITQSGHQGRPIFLLQELGVPVSYWAPTGNEADLTSADFLQWFVEQPEIGAIAMYLEAISDIESFVRSALMAKERAIPLLVVKSGSSDTGKATALTHTGKLAGSSQIVDALFERIGVIRLDTLEEWTDTTRFMVRAPRPVAAGLAVVSISGGTSAYSADLVEATNLQLARFDVATVRKIREHVPEPLKVDNPVDTGGHPLGDHRGHEILRAVLDDPEVGALICPMAAPFPPISTRFIRDLAELSKTSEKPICLVWSSPLIESTEVRSILDSAPQLHFFRSFRHCLTALSSWQRHFTRPSDVTKAEFILGPRRSPLAGDLPPIDELEARQMLVEGALIAPREYRVASPEEAVEYTTRLGFPVVIKGLSRTILHKADEALVALGCDSTESVRLATIRILERLRKISPDTVPEVLVAEQIPEGLDLLLGSVEDPEVGLAIVLGLGGDKAELIADFTYLVPPLTDELVMKAIRRLRNHQYVIRYLSESSAASAGLMAAIHAFTHYVTSHRNSINSAEINPLRVLSNGQVVMLDSVIT